MAMPRQLKASFLLAMVLWSNSFLAWGSISDTVFYKVSMHDPGQHIFKVNIF